MVEVRNNKIKEMWFLPHHSLRALYIHLVYSLTEPMLSTGATTKNRAFLLEILCIPKHNKTFPKTLPLLFKTKATTEETKNTHA